MPQNSGTMKSPIYAVEEFLSSAALNAAAAVASGSVNLAMQTAFPYAGLFYPENITLTPAGFVVSSTLPAPFGVEFGSGIFAQAHGIQTNQDTQSYSTDFTSLVPGSGSVTAYLLTSYMAIQQGPYQVIGPQPGHPDYDPTFVPYTAYAQQVDSLSLSASLTAPDNATTFELARGTLTAGATGITNFTIGNQLRASQQGNLQPISVSGNVNLSATHLGKFIYFAASGQANLPDLTKYNGCRFTIFGLGNVTVAPIVAGQNIYGYGSTPSSAVTGFVIPAGVLCQISSMAGIWVITEGNGTSIAGQNLLIAGSGTIGGSLQVSGVVQSKSFNSFIGHAESLNPGTTVNAYTVPDPGQSGANDVAGYIVFAGGTGPSATWGIVIATNGTLFVATQMTVGTSSGAPTISISGTTIRLTTGNQTANMGWSVTEFTYAPQ